MRWIPQLDRGAQENIRMDLRFLEDKNDSGVLKFTEKNVRY